MNTSRYTSFSPSIRAKHVAKPPGVRCAGIASSKTIVPGTVGSAVTAEIGESGTVIAVTRVPLACRFRVSIVRGQSRVMRANLRTR